MTTTREPYLCAGSGKCRCGRLLGHKGECQLRYDEVDDFRANWQGKTCDRCGRPVMRPILGDVWIHAFLDDRTGCQLALDADELPNWHEEH